MLSHLVLRDFAVVSAVELDLGRGLTVVSGETGAGKSLLVGALLTLTGARADSGMVRHGAEKAELSAEFELADAPQALAWLRENELDEDAACQLRRVIRADGGSRAWINGRPATLAQLAELGALLVEIHGQHEHQALLERVHQLEILDSFGRNAGVLAEVADLTRQWASIDRELADLARSGEVGERIDQLEQQLRELDRQDLDPSSIEDMLAAHRRQSHAAALLAGYDLALARLTGEDGIGLARSLHQVDAELSRHLDHEPRLAEVTALVESARIQLDEATSLLERWRDDLELDPAQLQALESRLAALHELSRRQRVPMEQLQARRQAIASELEGLRGQGERNAQLVAERARAEESWRAAAVRLGKARATAGKRLETAVSALMAELGMAGGVFEVELSPNEGKRPHASGMERCEFMVSANPGQPPRPLRKVASGGELARISLAIEVAALGLDTVPTMIFDEVDSGIGGAVAEVVGQKLRALGRERQVLCVTHLPQVAAQGHHHFQVSKKVNGGGTESVVLPLMDKQRVEELARMLGGVDVSPESRANARQMLASAQSD